MSCLRLSARGGCFCGLLLTLNRSMACFPFRLPCVVLRNLCFTSTCVRASSFYGGRRQPSSTEVSKFPNLFLTPLPPLPFSSHSVVPPDDSALFPPSRPASVPACRAPARPPGTVVPLVARVRPQRAADRGAGGVVRAARRAGLLPGGCGLRQVHRAVPARF